MLSHRLLLAVAAVCFCATVLGACGGAEGTGHGEPVIACIDSTISTDSVRASYLPDVEEVARRAAAQQVPLYAAACGANASGSVDWPVRRRFQARHDVYSGDLADDFADGQAKKLGPGLEQIVETSSALPGTPLGEMLGVAARQCAQVGGPCSIYVFTDAEWADRLLRVRDGVSAAEQSRYIDLYAPRLGGLAGAKVHFVGVGYGTTLGEIRLAEAQRVATALVQAAGGRVVTWAVRL